MKCKRCGTENNDSAKFCKKCGENFQAKIPNNKQTGTAVQKNGKKAKSKKKSNTGIIIFFVIIFLILIGVIAYLCYDMFIANEYNTEMSLSETISEKTAELKEKIFGTDSVDSSETVKNNDEESNSEKDEKNGKKEKKNKKNEENDENEEDNDEKTDKENSDDEDAADSYILADSDKIYYTEYELESLSEDELIIAKNEIYARHGKKFDDKILQEYFDGCSWYNGTIEPNEFSEDIFNKYENANKDLILKIEKKRNGEDESDTDKEYVLPNSDKEYLKEEDLKKLSSEELMIARNELYARHGRKFLDSKLQKHFNECSWYKGTIEPDDFNSEVFNKYEVANRDLIVKVENDRK